LFEKHFLFPGGLRQEHWSTILKLAFDFAEDKRGSNVPCGEEYHTSLHLPGRCGAVVGKRKKSLKNNS